MSFLRNSFQHVALSAGLLAGLAATLPAQASGSAEARITDVRIQVIDLDLSDGIDASVSFDAALPTFAYGDATQNVHQRSDGDLGTEQKASVISSPAGADTYAHVYAGDVYTLGAGPSAWAVATASGLDRLSNAQAYVFLSAITLSAHTEIIVSANASAIAAIGSFGERGYARAGVELSHNSTSSDTSYVDYFALPDGREVYDLAGPVQVSWSNTSDSAAVAHIEARASAQAWGVTTPVPEPETGALMLAGLFGLGLVARRRQA